MAKEKHLSDCELAAFFEKRKWAQIPQFSNMLGTFSANTQKNIISLIN